MSTDLPIEIKRRLDEIANEFEEVWSKEGLTHIEPYLEKVEAQYRSAQFDRLSWSAMSDVTKILSRIDNDDDPQQPISYRR